MTGAAVVLLGLMGFILGASWLATRNRLPTFKPCVIYYDEMRLTEMVLEDTSIVWCPWGDPKWGHAVDCGYAPDGRLVGIKIWDDVRTREPQS